MVNEEIILKILVITNMLLALCIKNLPAYGDEERLNNIQASWHLLYALLLVSIW